MEPRLKWNKNCFSMVTNGRLGYEIL